MLGGMKFEEAIKKAKELIEAAKTRGIPLRLMGSCSVYVHCPKYRKMFLGMRIDKTETPITDLDFVSYSKHQEQLEKLLTEMGCIPKSSLAYPTHSGTGGFTAVTLGREFSRVIYIIKETNTTIDVFMDKLAMCHTIDFRNRLEIDYPTIPLADILLEKMQIVEIAEKDIKDTIALFLEHDVGDSDEETINAEYISKLLAEDWGFYYTVTTNLKSIRNIFLPLYKEQSILSGEFTETIRNRIEKLLDRIEREPKTLKWKLRSIIGKRKKWYQDVG
jgi:hypothetical protein